MENPSGSFAFRVAIFLVFLIIAIAGFTTIAVMKFCGDPQTDNANAANHQPILQTDNINRTISEAYSGDLAIFEAPEREQNLQIFRVMDILKIKEGSNVADIGAGSGWFTVRAARRVGANGTVYANEINQDYLNHIAERAKNENLPNIKNVLGKEDNPLLPENSIDAVLILKTYHEIAQPIRLMKNLRKSLRPNARVGIIDRNGKGDDHGVSRDSVVIEAEQSGYRLVEEHDFVKPDGMDYFLVFEQR